MIAEQKIEGDIERDYLDKSAEKHVSDGIKRPAESVEGRIYKEDEKRVERAIEKSGEKVKQGVPVAKKGDPDDDEEDSAPKSVRSNIDEMKKMDVDEQVDHLVQVAIRKDPILAIGIAKHLNDNYILDELHSDLTEDKIRDILIEKKLI